MALAEWLAYALMPLSLSLTVQNTPEVGLLVHQCLLLGGERYMFSNGADPEEHGS